MVDKRETAAWRDQQADAMGSVNDYVECMDEHCDRSERWKHIKKSEGWQVSMDPEVPLLCPSCAERTPTPELTPSEARRELNRSLNNFSEDDSNE